MLVGLLQRPPLRFGDTRIRVRREVVGREVEATARLKAIDSLFKKLENSTCYVEFFSSFSLVYKTRAT